MSPFYAELTNTDLAAIVTIVVCLVAVMALTWVIATLLRVVRESAAVITELGTRAGELLGELEVTVTGARGELERVDDLIGSAEALASTVDSAARVGYFTVGKPVIKTMALAKGTSRAARRLRTPKAG